MGQLVILVQVLVVDNAPESKNLLHVAILSVSTQDSMKITTAHPPHGRWREKPEHCRGGSTIGAIVGKEAIPFRGTIQSRLSAWIFNRKSSNRDWVSR